MKLTNMKFEAFFVWAFLVSTVWLGGCSEMRSKIEWDQPTNSPASAPPKTTPTQPKEESKAAPPPSTADALCHRGKTTQPQFAVLGVELAFEYINPDAPCYFRTVYGEQTTVVGQKTVRNAILFELMGVVDDDYYRYERWTRSERAYKDIIVTWISLGLTGFVAVGGSAGTKAILGAIDTGLKGANAAVDLNAFADNAPGLLINTMRADRDKEAKAIYDGMGKSADDYSLEEGLRDISTYYSMGTITSAIATLVATTSKDATEAKNDATAQKKCLAFTPDQVATKMATLAAQAQKANDDAASADTKAKQTKKKEDIDAAANKKKAATTASDALKAYEAQVDACKNVVSLQALQEKKPGAAASEKLVSGSPQKATVLKAFDKPLEVIVSDSSGQPVPGVKVTFKVPNSGASATFGGGSLSDEVETDSSGDAQSPALTANAHAGEFKATATAAGVSDAVSFDLTNVADTQEKLIASAGTNQEAKINEPFAKPLSARVSDKSDNAVQDVEVIFTLQSTGPSGVFVGGAKTASVKTDKSGVATSPTIRANSVFGTWVAIASAKGINKNVQFAMTNTDAQARLMTSKGTSQTTAKGSRFAEPLIVAVLDASGKPLKGVPVKFSIRSGAASGHFEPKGTVVTVPTAADGTASTENYPIIAGEMAGTLTVTASVLGIPNAAEFKLTIKE